MALHGLDMGTANAESHSAVSGDVVVDTRARTLEYEPLPEPEGEGEEPAPPVETLVLGSARMLEGGEFETVLAVPVPGQLVDIYSSSDLVGTDWRHEATLLAASKNTRICALVEGNERRFFRAQSGLSFAPGEIGFIDPTCDLSTLSDDGEHLDSDNYYLRQNGDHLGLDIAYRVPPRLAGQLTGVAFWVYRGDSGQKVAEVDGAMSGAFHATGDRLRVAWNAPLPSRENDPGFFVVEMRVEVDGRLIYCSPTGDRDRDPANGWQCQQDCLAVWDPVWRHRPILHLGEATGGIERPISPVFFLAVATLYEKGNAGSPAVANPTVDDLTSGEYNTREHYLDVGIPYTIDRSGITADPGAHIMHTASDHQFSGVAGATGRRQPGERYTAANEAYLFAQYWMFYDFSNSASFLGNIPYHEGDLEYMQVAIRKWHPDSRGIKALWMRPFAATASQHYYGQTLAWFPHDGGRPSSPQAIQHVAHDGRGRPEIYVAEGTHATYFAGPGQHKVRDILDGIPGCEDVPFLGTQIQYDAPDAGDTREGIRDATRHSYVLAPMPDWFATWKGRWGYKESSSGDRFCATAKNGPHGPILRDAYEDPDTPVNLRDNPVRFHNLSRRQDDIDNNDRLYIPEN